MLCNIWNISKKSIVSVFQIYLHIIQRHQIRCVWKISQGLIEGYSLDWVWSERRGRLAVPNNIPRNDPCIVKEARERDHQEFMVYASLTCFLFISKKRIPETSPSSRTTWTCSWPLSQISLPPQAWPELLSTYCMLYFALFQPGNNR